MFARSVIPYYFVLQLRQLHFIFHNFIVLPKETFFHEPTHLLLHSCLLEQPHCLLATHLSDSCEMGLRRRNFVFKTVARQNLIDSRSVVLMPHERTVQPNFISRIHIRRVSLRSTFAYRLMGRIQRDYVSNLTQRRVKLASFIFLEPVKLSLVLLSR